MHILPIYKIPAFTLHIHMCTNPDYMFTIIMHTRYCIKSLQGLPNANTCKHLHHAFTRAPITNSYYVYVPFVKKNELSDAIGMGIRSCCPDGKRLKTILRHDTSLVSNIGQN